MFVKIEDFEEEKIWSGTIIRIHLEHQSEFYYTDKVFDIIVFENYTEEMGLGAMQISGYKAGKINLFFPKESYFDESFYTRDLCTKQPLCSRHTTKQKKNKEWQ